MNDMASHESDDAAQVDVAVGPASDRLTWGFILGSSAGAAAWIMFDLWWLVGAGILAGIAVTSWRDHSDS